MSLFSFLFGGDEEKREKREKDEAKAKASPKEDTSKSFLRRMFDDAAMDIGATTKDADYFARLEDRQKRSEDMMKSMMTRDRSQPSTPEPEPIAAPEPTPVSAPKLTPPPAPKPVTPPQPVEVVAPKTTETQPSKPKADEGAGAPEAPDTGVGTTTASGGQEEAQIIEAAAQGPAETNVAETARRGRRSTIATTPRGLLTDGKSALRKRRSLMGGLIS
jgi:hypothetical protein